MYKKFVLNRVDLGQRVTGYEVFNPGVNGGEVIGMTAKQLSEAVKSCEVLGMVLDGSGALKLDEAKGFRAIMVKTGENYKVISSRFGRQTFCADKIKALLDLGAVNGVVLDGDTIKCAWEWEEMPQGKTVKK